MPQNTKLNNTQMLAALANLEAEWKAFQSAHGSKQTGSTKRKQILASVSAREQRFWTKDEMSEDSLRQNDASYDRSKE